MCCSSGVHAAVRMQTVCVCAGVCEHAAQAVCMPCKRRACRWSPRLSRDALAHWLDLMNVQGWIPRYVRWPGSRTGQCPCQAHTFGLGGGHGPALP